MPSARLLLIQLSVIGALGRSLEAQSAQPISLQASALFNGVFGNVFNALQDGFGAEAQIRYTPGALSIGAGFQYTEHGLDVRDEKARLYGAFIEPRYRIRTGSNVVAPYISTRFSLLKVGFSGGDLSLSSNFSQINGGGGLLYRIGSQLNLDLGATYGYNRLGRGTLRDRSSATEEPVEPSSGSNIIVRMGIALGIGG
jgi:hypothetical protein